VNSLSEYVQEFWAILSRYERHGMQDNIQAFTHGIWGEVFEWLQASKSNFKTKVTMYEAVLWYKATHSILDKKREALFSNGVFKCKYCGK
jgi:hypothetical protein